MRTLCTFARGLFATIAVGGLLSCGSTSIAGGEAGSGGAGGSTPGAGGATLGTGGSTLGAGGSTLGAGGSTLGAGGSTLGNREAGTDASAGFGAGTIDAEASAPAGSCRETVTWPGAAYMDSYRQYTWNDASRVKSLESETSDAGFTGHADLAWRYGGAGQLLAYAGFADATVNPYGNFQHDYRYDAHGNMVDFKLTYPSKPDLTVPSPADVWMGTEYRNEYDSQGRLTACTAVPYGPGNAGITGTRITYREDALGRCDRVERTSAGVTSIDTIVYDANDNVIRVETADANANAGPWVCSSPMVLNTFDDRGRITASQTWCGEPGDAGGAGRTLGRATTYAYEPDGTRRVDNIDYLNDTPNEIVPTGDGGFRALTHWIEISSPACALIEAAIGKPADHRCRVPGGI